MKLMPMQYQLDIQRYTNTLVIPIVAGIVMSILSLPVAAQTMYRCGSSYQDRPCDNAQQGKIIGTVSTSRPAGAAEKPLIDLSCTRRGEEAKKIIWSREGGAQQDKLMAQATSAESRKLIADVYAIRANSSEVRAAIERDCMAEKARAGQVSYPLDDVAPAPSRNAERTLASAADMDKRAENQARNENAGARKRAQCELLKSQLANNRNQQRNGGAGAAMDSLNQQRRDRESELKTAGCDGTPGALSIQ